jgi:orotidine-5'-phosphate decarboxylase
LEEQRVIVALDYGSSEEALGLVAKVDPGTCKLKVGTELFTSAGPALVGKLVDRGFDVFLDLKFHDIPNTVARACTAAARLGVWMLNVHSLGGTAMLRAAREAIDTVAKRPLLVAVTILTSHAQGDMEEIGVQGELASRVDALAALAHDAGLDGVVCSPWEVARLRSRFGQRFVLVTPGIRPRKLSRDDQARTLSPSEALAQGASYLVIGRPITRAPDPVRALAEINHELAGA